MFAIFFKIKVASSENNTFTSLQNQRFVFCQYWHDLDELVIKPQEKYYSIGY